MKLLAICQYYHPDRFRVTAVCEALAAGGHDVSLLTGFPCYPGGRVVPGYRGFKKRRETKNGVRIRRVSVLTFGISVASRVACAISFAAGACMRAFWAALRGRENFDAAFVYQLSPVSMALPALMLKKLCGCKILLYCCDLWPESLLCAGVGKSSLLFRAAMKLSRFIYERCDIIAVTSPEFTGYFDKTFGLSAVYIPQHADDIFAHSGGAPASADRNVRFLIAGNIGKSQDFAALFATLGNLAGDFCVDVLGDGCEKERAISIAAGSGIADKVFFYPAVSEEKTVFYYERADALLFALCPYGQVFETLPARLQTYMAAGKPIFCIAGKSAASVIREAKCGFCEPSADALTARLQAFIDCPKKYGKLGARGRDYYLKHFTLAGYIEEITGLLYSLRSKENAA